MDPPVSSRNPEASIVGFRSRTPAISVRRSTIGRTELMDILKALGRATIPGELRRSASVALLSCPCPAVTRWPVMGCPDVQINQPSSGDMLMRGARVIGFHGGGELEAVGPLWDCFLAGHGLESRCGVAEVLGMVDTD